MAYEFKRLADVEALTEAPENAMVLGVVDNEVKKFPVSSGNAKLEDMIFNLDCEAVSGSLYFSDVSQIQKALDNGMNIYIVSYGDASGTRYIFRKAYTLNADCIAISTSSGGVSGYVYADNNGGTVYKLSLVFDSTAYESGKLIVTRATAYINDTLIRAYASIF